MNRIYVQLSVVHNIAVSSAHWQNKHVVDGANCKQTALEATSNLLCGKTTQDETNDGSDLGQNNKCWNLS